MFFDAWVSNPNCLSTSMDMLTTIDAAADPLLPVEPISNAINLLEAPATREPVVPERVRWIDRIKQRIMKSPQGVRPTPRVRALLTLKQFDKKFLESNDIFFKENLILHTLPPQPVQPERLPPINYLNILDIPKNYQIFSIRDPRMRQQADLLASFVSSHRYKVADPGFYNFKIPTYRKFYGCTVALRDQLIFFKHSDDAVTVVWKNPCDAGLLYDYFQHLHCRSREKLYGWIYIQNTYYCLDWTATNKEKFIQLLKNQSSLRFVSNANPTYKRFWIDASETFTIYLPRPARCQNIITIQLQIEGFLKKFDEYGRTPEGRQLWLSYRQKISPITYPLFINNEEFDYYEN